jgi:hypothetical protein
MPVRHYYHAYAGGLWQVPVAEHLAAIGDAALGGMDAMVTGLAGPGTARREARDVIAAGQRAWGCPPHVARWIEADEGWEQLTLQAIHEDVHEIPGELAILYVHTKGAHDDSPVNKGWRRGMTRQVVGQWQRCTELLAEGYDAVGCHWVVQYPENPPFFAGNFWWARASYLRTLAPPVNDSRYTAELWLSQGAPRVFDLVPGWPGYG